MKKRLSLVGLGMVAALLLLEIGARIWVASHWSPELVYVLTHLTEDRGRFTGDPEQGYTTRPNFRDPTGRFTHNSYGFRGHEFEVPKPAGAVRVVLVGASTIYGIYVSDDETSASQLERRLSKLFPGRQVEALNAGVPGWNSAETLLSLRKRALSLRPDFIVVCDGRNDAFPQLFNNYQPDYSHYRIQGSSFRNSNYIHKNLFRLSHLFMFVSARGQGRFGFSYRDEDPAYAVINYANLPTAEELLRNAEDLTREEAFRGNMRGVVQLARELNAEPILSTIPFLPEVYGSGVIPRDGRTLSAIANRVGRNNEIVRSVAKELNAGLVEGASLTRTDLLQDDCHFNAQGEAVFADLMLEAIRRKTMGNAVGRAATP
jgi:lysophospholipase L1-like esterase